MSCVVCGRRGAWGGRPRIDLASAARCVLMLASLVREGMPAGIHDLSVGGLGIALARMAIASGCGATVTLPPAARWPTAALFGERAGRALVSVGPGEAARLAALAESRSVGLVRLGTAGGDALAIRASVDELVVSLPLLAAAWERPF